MSGLQPDGLGENRVFGETEHEAVGTEEATIGGNENIKYVFAPPSSPGSEQDVYDAIDSLPSNRESQATIVLIGEFIFDNHLHLPSYTFLDAKNAFLRAGSGLSAGYYMITLRRTRDGSLLSQSNGPEQVTIKGPYMDGQNNPVGAIQTWGNTGSGGSDYYETRNRVYNAMMRNFDGSTVFAGSTRRGYYENISIAYCNANYGFRLGVGGGGDSVAMDIHTEEVSGLGISCERGFQHLYRPIAQYCGQGFKIAGVQGTQIHGGYTEYNDEWGILVEDGAERTAIYETLVLANGQATNSPGIKTSQAGGVIRDVVVRDNQATETQTTGIELTTNASDVNLAPQLVEATTRTADSGTGTRWQDVLGGGPLGGVDLSTVAGTNDGDEAMSDGTATGFPKFTRAHWDSVNSQWVRVDGQATV